MTKGSDNSLKLDQSDVQTFIPEDFIMTSVLRPKASTTTVPSLRFTQGELLAEPQTGALEFYSNEFYGTQSDGVRKVFLCSVGRVYMVHSDYVLQYYDQTVVASHRSATITLTLMETTGYIGQIFHIKNINTEARDVIVAAASGETIDGAASITLAQWGHVTLQCYDVGMWGII